MSKPNVNTARLTVQPDKSLVIGDCGAAVSSVYSLPAVCKAVELAPGATSGVIEIHLIRDPVSRWYLLPLAATECKGRVFDKIRTTNTTVDLAEVTFFEE